MYFLLDELSEVNCCLVGISSTICEICDDDCVWLWLLCYATQVEWIPSSDKSWSWSKPIHLPPFLFHSFRKRRREGVSWEQEGKRERERGRGLMVMLIWSEIVYRLKPWATFHVGFKMYYCRRNFHRSKPRKKKNSNDTFLAHSTAFSHFVLSFSTGTHGPIMGWIFGVLHIC